MNNYLNDTLPDLLRRATESLEPESADLVERGMRRGVALRRRRTALLSVSGASAVLATAGIVIAGTQVFGGSTQPPAAGAKNTQTAKPVTQKESLETLIKLLPARLKVQKTETWSDAGNNGADVVVDDGKGASKLSMMVSSIDGICAEQPNTCKVRPDGSRIWTVVEEAASAGGSNAGGVVRNAVLVTDKAGGSISLISYNAGDRGSDRSRAKPALSVAELTAIADSKLWRFPARPPMPAADPQEPKPDDPGAGKPGVPVQQTLQILKKALPRDLHVSTPYTWGGGAQGFNRVSYLVDDGKGQSQIQAFLTYEAPVTKCAGERATANCQALPNGSVIGWTKEAPTYSGGRQDAEGVLQNSAEIHYPDGRFIRLTSYNAIEEKGVKHTRPKPAFTTDELLQMAGNKAWKFPGSGEK
ncbi:hypothetical protein [Kribbella sp. NPDC049227]|uniref:hypothetical protein n=1 Tax=Kribbella sp. NPDC049227 TaxID=3364113 RepID=UPI00371B5B86